ncbi:MAG: hypothetical protein K0R46_1905 [Herbinix sp.]|nr:hypothetical protein [Herbinix sp.]
MLIHVVKQGETLQSIADYYGISIERLIIDNGLNINNTLVIGQTIVITYPEITHIVQEGDTLGDIASTYQVSILQLYRNNPYLHDRVYLIPGEVIVIKYDTKGQISTHGNTLSFINQHTLRRTLPYLTYLSILNYTATKDGEIITYYDETEIIRIAKEYSVVPLMLLTTLTIVGESNIDVFDELLLNTELQNKQIENVFTILKTKGYYGVNISLEYINANNLTLFESYFRRITERLGVEGYLVFVTINTNISIGNNGVPFEVLDYTILYQITHNIIFMDFHWATSVGPPSPISSIGEIDLFLSSTKNYISPDKEIIGLAIIGYDWELPYYPGLSSVYTLTSDRVIDLARNVGAAIQFDDISQTPYFRYVIDNSGNLIVHIVWFIDARSINALLSLVDKYKLNGIGIWNITIYNNQLWLIINSQYDIVKLI